MYLLKPPLVESRTKGIIINSMHVAENSAAGLPEARYLADEQLKSAISYDGSNQLCGVQERGWQFVFVAPQSNDTFEVGSRDPFINLYCIPPRTRIAQALIAEESHYQRPGVWLRLDLEGDSDVPFVYFGLIHYHLAG
jgi:hypothetical protein